MRVPQLSRRLTLALVAAVAVLLTGAGVVLADGLSSGNDNPWPYNSPGKSPVLAAVGDISCQPDGDVTSGEKTGSGCSGGTSPVQRNEAQNATAMEVENMHPALVAVLGDLQYQTGYYKDFEASYDKYWGAFKFLERPAPGNHEFYGKWGQPAADGLGYFAYFNGIQHNGSDGSEVDTTANGVSQPLPQPSGQAGNWGQNGDGWYSYNLGHWHLISLNAECANQSGGCAAGGSWLTSETNWLAQDLAQNHQQCTVAYWHQPTFSSTATPFTSDSAEGEAADAWWKLLYKYHATLVLNGHDHVYSRFAPMDPSGNYDPHGVREFIVGTGGEALDTVIPSTPNLQKWADEYYGVLKLTLNPDSYNWDYQSALESPGDTTDPAHYMDSGTGKCMGSDQGSDQGN